MEVMLKMMLHNLMPRWTRASELMMETNSLICRKNIVTDGCVDEKRKPCLMKTVKLIQWEYVDIVCRFEVQCQHCYLGEKLIAPSALCRTHAGEGALSRTYCYLLSTFQAVASRLEETRKAGSLQMIDIAELAFLRHLGSTPLNILSSGFVTIGRWHKPRGSQTSAECGNKLVYRLRYAATIVLPTVTHIAEKCKARLEAGMQCLLLAVSGYAKRLSHHQLGSRSSNLFSHNYSCTQAHSA